MSPERSEIIFQDGLPVEINRIGELQTFSFLANGNRTLVANGTFEQIGKGAELIRHSLFDGDLDTRISYRKLPIPNEWENISSEIWFLRTGSGVHHHLPPALGSQGSEALYAARGDFPEGIFLEQMVDTFARTSHHRHLANQDEYYFGDGHLLILKGEEEVVQVNGLIKIEAGTPHVAFTLDKPAITHIFNAGTGIEHIPMEDQLSIEFLVEKARDSGLVEDYVYQQFKELQAKA